MCKEKGEHLVRGKLTLKPKLSFFSLKISINLKANFERSKFHLKLRTTTDALSIAETPIYNNMGQNQRLEKN